MKIYCDGYCIGKNPSPFGGGYTIVGEQGLIETQRIEKYNFTNNEAELLAAYNACLLAEKGDEIIVDSENTLKWIKKGKCKARPDLSDYARLSKKKIENKKLRIYWRPREENLAGHYNENHPSC